ncbi:MAG: AmmeMemoRadiSam system protein B [Phycisphaerales bacterium]|nr:MAG: AmmeMemoRadiSam system protein B [Phycisphaerales bacterium]
MTFPDTAKPKLRPGIEAGRFPETPDGMITLYDRVGLTRTAVNVSQMAAWLIGQMDGSHTLAWIRQTFEQAAQQRMEDGTLEALVGRLDECLFLEGPTFEAHYASLVEQYRSLPERPALAAGMQSGPDGLADELAGILADAAAVDGDDAVVGLIAPHLDYARGRPCYAAAYSRIARRRRPDRIVVLGTNHAARTLAPTVTGHAYATALGRTPADVEFIERLESRCGDLRRCELDHAFEHSVELQVIWCQHLFGADQFQLVPILCSDPTAPTEVLPPTAGRMGAAEVGQALHELLADDPKDTLLIAGADLSHVGRAFGDVRLLDAAFLQEVRERDTVVLDHVKANNARAFLEAFSGDNNPTRVCSIGCIYMLMRALPGARADVIAYHQAVDQGAQTGVTCAAAVLVGGKA